LFSRLRNLAVPMPLMAVFLSEACAGAMLSAECVATEYARGNGSLAAAAVEIS
jgi:hypothetical protein